MGLQLDIDLPVKGPDFLVGPHVADFVFAVFLEARDIAKVGGLGGRFIQSVEDEDVDPTLGTAGVELGGVGLVPRPRRVDAPFVRESGGAPGVVLVEGEELPVLQHGEVFVVNGVQLLENQLVVCLLSLGTTTYWSSDEQWGLQRRPDSEMGPRLLCS